MYKADERVEADANIVYPAPLRFAAYSLHRTIGAPSQPMRQFANNSSPSRPRQRRSLPRIAITMGDPAGIGPEVVLKAVAEEEIQRVCLPIIIGDAQLLAHTARTSRSAIRLRHCSLG